MKLIRISAALVLCGLGCSNPPHNAVSTTGVTTTQRAEQAVRSGPLGSPSITGQAPPAVAPPAGEPTGHPGGVSSPSTPPPTGITPSDIAARVALTVWADPDWHTTVAADLSPSFLGFVRSQQRSVPVPAEARPVLLISVEVDTTNSNRYLVAFDEQDALAPIRHVTAIDFDDATTTRPLVVDVVPIV